MDKTPNPLIALATTKNLSQRLYAALDWPRAIRDDMPFVITSLTYELDVTSGEARIAVHYAWHYGEDRNGVLFDKASEFPSAALVATFSLMAGPVEQERRRWRENVEKQTNKERIRSKYSDRPW